MLTDSQWLLTVIVAVLIDFKVGELKTRHPVEYFGDFVKWYIKEFYKDSVRVGAILLGISVVVIWFGATIIQDLLYAFTRLFNITPFIAIFILGILASTGLASHCLKEYVQNVLNADETDKRKQLSVLVSRNTEVLDDRMLYGSLIETHSENLSDGVIAPLFYLILFGLPGIAVYKAVNTLDSMIGYKNEKYKNFGKAAAICDDVLNYLPARITAFLIYILSKKKVRWETIKADANRYSSSPNAGYPVVAAAYNLGVKLGGTVYYDDMKVEKAEVGPESDNDIQEAAKSFIKVHSQVEKIILFTLLVLIIVKVL